MGVNHSIEKIGDVTAAAIEKTGRDSVESVTVKIEENINNLLKTLQPLFKSAETPLVVAGIIASGVGFAAASASLFRSYQVLTGTDATSALLKLGVSIDKSLRTAADNLEAMNARQCQREFHKHVYQYVNMMSHGASPDTYFFVFHPGTDWYPAFHEMNTERPLARFAGYFSNFNTMHVYLNVFRKAAGPISYTCLCYVSRLAPRSNVTDSLWKAPSASLQRKIFGLGD
ncbi:uncharacterized protein K460DRAFT_353723 [Cucurbitaria berberidis CBS 394.84]|uniref:Uncharacterized protein n=1 Tax=Cucurbitaria berberidis CBS 394.84 TaxID=1168544 RepID=A0A9P4LAU2_9PLEO|nr:uncharacterized protein K460DRAFT_353723 [Cucurbitaria berberidis CBS 394.84]KAF1848781.1 hypothetical protein K460DRAFT_353723 [Cucurbitaria berberidis CBS 394.84]